MKKLMKISCLLMTLLFTYKVQALTPAEVANRPTDCPVVELAEAKEDGSLNKVQCYNSYSEAKQVMNQTPNDNLVIIEGRRIVDAKYALIDYDQSTSAGYINVYTDRSTSTNFSYITGGDSDDAVFLELDHDSGRIKIKVGGLTGWIKRYEIENGQINNQYDIVPLSWVKSPSYYQISENDIIHHLPRNVYGTKGEYSFSFGPKPPMIGVGNYYSYDGHYFYQNLKTMINDYKNNQVSNSVNATQPYYNYYMYLSFRTKTNYNADNINQFISKRTNSNSKLYNTGQSFIDNQNKYGINALLMLAIGINESAFGNSNIAQTKNNLFGLNAVDATPGESANYFPNVETCISDYAYVWLDYGYVQPGDYRFRGANLGNKQQGLNLKYASDPYWGEKAAQYFYDFDKMFSFQDYNTYQVAVLNNNYTNTVYPKKTPGGLNVSSSFYQYKQADSAVVILEEVNGPAVNGNSTWYKIMSDPTLDGDLEYIGDSKSNPRITYDWSRMFVYVPAAYFSKVNTTSGNKPPVNPDNPLPPPTKSIESIVSGAGYRYSSGRITNINPGTTVESLKLSLESQGGLVQIVNSNGNIVTSGLLQTGSQVRITSGVMESLSVIIYGDLNGDGQINSADLLRIRQHLLGSNPLTGAYEQAAYMGYSTINSANLLKIRQHLLGTDTIKQ